MGWESDMLLQAWQGVGGSGGDSWDGNWLYGGGSTSSSSSSSSSAGFELPSSSSSQPLHLQPATTTGKSQSFSNKAKSKSAATRHHAVSFVDCPICKDFEDDDLQGPKRMSIPAPACILNDTNCEGDEGKEALEYVNSINNAMKKSLSKELKWRAAFERRTCDFVVAQHKGLRTIMHNYGPNGPQTEAGAYTWYLKKYALQLRALHQACSQSYACSELMFIMPEKVHKLPAPFFVYDEFKRACDLYRTKAPVPNYQRAWCMSPSAVGFGEELGHCEVGSCKQW